MAYVLVQHKVEDYNKWKAAFEEHSNFRSQNGSKGGKVFQNADNPNELFVLLEWESFESAQRFIQSDNLKDAMQQAGVVGMPAIHFVEEAITTST